MNMKEELYICRKQITNEKNPENISHTETKVWEQMYKQLDVTNFRCPEKQYEINMGLNVDQTVVERHYAEWVVTRISKGFGRLGSKQLNTVHPFPPPTNTH